jgi:chaperonin cofactor prefoldin
MNDQIKINDLTDENEYLRKQLKAVESKRDHYRSELQRLQASRGACNRRKARRFARDMNSAREGQVQS